MFSPLKQVCSRNFGQSPTWNKSDKLKFWAVSKEKNLLSSYVFARFFILVEDNDFNVGPQARERPTIEAATRQLNTSKHMAPPNMAQVQQQSNLTGWRSLVHPVNMRTCTYHLCTRLQTCTPESCGRLKALHNSPNAWFWTEKSSKEHSNSLLDGAVPKNGCPSFSAFSLKPASESKTVHSEGVRVFG